MVINKVKYIHVLIHVLASMISNKHGSYKGPCKNGSKIFLKRRSDKLMNTKKLFLNHRHKTFPHFGFKILIPQQHIFPAFGLLLQGHSDLFIKNGGQFLLPVLDEYHRRFL